MTFKKYKLANGLRVLFAPKSDSLAATILVLVEAGSKYETKKINGLSHFLEHLCFKGTPSRPRAADISSELDALGSQYNAFTAQEYTGYYATVQPKLALRALEIVSDLYLNPLFNPAEIEKEKGVIIEEINMYEDLPMRKVGDLFMALLYGDQPAGWDIAGPKAVVKSLTRDQLLDYRHKHYVAAATTIVVSGAFNETKALAQIKNYFSPISTTAKQAKKPVREKQTKPGLLVRSKTSDQTHLVLGFRSCALSSKDLPAVEVLATVLGGGMSSRLFQRVRDELGAAYYIRAAQESFTDHGYLAVAAGVDTRRAPEVSHAILDECRRLREQPVGAAELRKVKDYLIGNLFLELETAQNLALFYGTQEILKRPLLTPQAWAAKIERVSAASVKRLAKIIFTNRRLNLAVIGPFDDPRPFVKVLTV